MKIIGLQWDHHSSATLLDGHEIVACASEERYSREKNDSRFPKNAADYCIRVAGGFGAIEGVAIANFERSYEHFLINPFNSFEIRDFIKEQHLYWKPRFYEDRQDQRLRHIFPEYIDREQYPIEYWSVSNYDEEREKSFASDVDTIVANYFCLPIEKVKKFDHHTCHARYALHSSDFHEDPTLVLTIDGQGDGSNATIFLNEGGNLKCHYRTADCLVGRYYRHITLLLGMRPLEHEYKLMGLAPYSWSKEAERVLNILNGTLTVDGIHFVPGLDKPLDSYFSFQHLFEGIRIDYIAAGLQRWVEQILEQWVRNVVKHFDIATVVIGGGVAMNVKAMGHIGQQPWIRRFFVPGSASDESSSMGAALCWAHQQGVDLSKAVPTLYLGPTANGYSSILKMVEKDGHVTLTNPSMSQIAQVLMEGAILGRCVGRMEFGQRALGNRSILADPINYDLVSRINSMIKNRDFWMPFAPIILDIFADKYIINPNLIDSPYMTIAYQTTEDGYRALQAACHPGDRTARAQILSEDQNPLMYKLLEEFQLLTGRGGLLNTSFNLHGHPIVKDSIEAYEVFNTTELEGLILQDVLILKKECLDRNDFLSQIFEQ